MNRRRVYAAICLVTSVFSLDFTACTSMPPPPHDLSDPGRHDPLAEEYWKLSRVSRGTQLTVATRDSGFVTGRYDGFDREPAPEYEARYRAWASDSLAPAPRLAFGVPVRMTGSGSSRDSGSFHGFDFGVVRYTRAGESKERIAQFREIRRLEDSTGTVILGDSLASWLDNGRIPIGSRLRLTEHGQTRWLALDRIVALHAHGTPASVKIAIVAGIVVLAIVVIASLPKSEPAPPSSGCEGGSYTYALGSSASR